MTKSSRLCDSIVHFVKVACCVCLSLLMMPIAQAGVVLTVSPQFEGPMFVGKEATFAVQLSGIPEETGIDFLSAQIVYDPALLENPDVIPGSIVSATQPESSEFLTASQVGMIDAAFMTFASSPEKHIQENGTFFTFSLTPKKKGDWNS